MDQPAANNPPIATTDVAVKDVGSAIDFILERRGVSKLSLMGWSWALTPPTTMMLVAHRRPSAMSAFALLLGDKMG